MADTLTTITNIINSPPGQLVAGGVWQPTAIQFGLGLGLLYGVMKFFERVESVLNENTKLEIAVWLLEVHPLSAVGPALERPTIVFVRMLDRVFGGKQLSRALSFRYFWHSCVVTTLTVACLLIHRILTDQSGVYRGKWGLETSLIDAFELSVILALPDYVSLVKTRFVLLRMGPVQSRTRRVPMLIGDCLLSMAIGFLPVLLIGFVTWHFEREAWDPDTFREYFSRMLWGAVQANGKFSLGLFGYPVFFAFLWFFLYSCSGVLLKAARRFDIGFDWFNRHFDIEKKPLQSIGLVAGALVAVVYWAAVIVSRVVG